MDIKKRLYELRIEKDYSISLLSKKSGVAASSIQRIESGERNPTVEIMTKICNGLGITLKDFFDEDNIEITVDMMEVINRVKELSPEQIKAFSIFLSTLDK